MIVAPGARAPSGAVKALLIPPAAPVKVVHLDLGDWLEQIYLVLATRVPAPLTLTDRWNAWTRTARRRDAAARNHRATSLARSYGALRRGCALHGPVLVTGLNPAAGVVLGLQDAQIEAIRRRTDELT
jgi:hypothetical protein